MVTISKRIEELIVKSSFVDDMQDGKVQVRFNYGTTQRIPWSVLLELLTTGIRRAKYQGAGEWTETCEKWELSQIVKVSFNLEFRIISLIPGEEIDDATRAICCALSPDYARNGNTIAFWYLQHTNTCAIAGVIRHTDLMKLNPPGQFNPAMGYY